MLSMKNILEGLCAYEVVFLGSVDVEMDYDKAAS